MMGLIIFLIALGIAVGIIMLSIPYHYVCGLCGKEFRFQFSLDGHIKYNHPDFIGQNPNGSLIIPNKKRKCEDCSADCNKRGYTSYCVLPQSFREKERVKK